MSNTQRALDEAATLLHVDPHDLTAWVLAGKYRPMPRHGTDTMLVSGPIYRAASSLGIHPNDLDRWLHGPRSYAPVPPVDGESVSDDLDASVAERTARDGIVREVVRNGAGEALVILEHRGASNGTASTFVRPAAELVSEDDYRGVAADLISRWADGHADAATTLGSLNLAAHGMPVTTPSRRALRKVRERVDHSLTCTSRSCLDGLPAALTALLDEVGA